jgi:ribosome-binding protein aMBF1 (putative translation factor)
MARKPNTALIYQRVPKYLRELRESAGITQRELADRVGKNQSWVARCETGNRRIDIAEWVEWCLGSRVDPKQALDALIRSRT